MRIAATISMLLSVLLTGAQSADNPSQYVVHLPMINPAAIVHKPAMNGALFYKQQWVGFEGAPTTVYANFNLPIHNFSSYVGASLSNRSVGVTNRFSFSGIYAYKGVLSDNAYFSLALSPGVEAIQSNYGDIRTDYENDPLFGGQAVNMTSINTGFGAFFFHSRYFAGLSIAQLFHNSFEAVSAGSNQGKLSFDAKQIPLALHGGWRTDIGPLFSIEPSSVVRYISGNPLQVDVNAMVLYRRKMGILLGYRTANQLVLGFNVQAGRDWRIAYAYHTQLGGALSTANSGSHEIGIVFGADNLRTTRVNMPGQVKRYKRKLKRNEKEPIYNPGGKLKKQPFS